MTHKLVKVRIRAGDHSKGESQMIYPKRYNPHEVDRRGVGPTAVARGSAAYSGHIGRGGEEEWCFIILPDELAEEYAQDPDMELATPAQADTDMEAWRQIKGETAEVVTDIDRIHAIRAKQGAGIPLTAEDLAALDIDNDVPGIEKRLKPLRAQWRKRGLEIA
jgi:hypothetical protein